MFSQIIIETLPGSNVELFLDYLKKDPMVYFIIKEWDRTEFIEKYEKDLNDGIIVNPINPELYSEENWYDFIKNAYAYLEGVYDITFNRIIIQVTHGLEEGFAKTPLTKKITYIRNPQYMWGFNDEVVWRSKPIMYHYRKLLDKNIKNSQIYEFLDARSVNLKEHQNDILNVCRKLSSFPIFYEYLCWDYHQYGVITKLLNYYLNMGIFEFDFELTQSWYLQFWTPTLSVQEKIDWSLFTFRSDSKWINFTTKQQVLDLIHSWYKAENTRFTGKPIGSPYPNLTLTQIETLPNQ